MSTNKDVPKDGEQGGSHNHAHKARVPPEKISLMGATGQVKTSKAQAKDGLKSEMRRVAPQSAPWLDGLCDAVDALPDASVGRLSKALQEYPSDFRLLVSNTGRIAGGQLPDPRKQIDELIRGQNDFSFCAHPLTGEVYVGNIEDGHEQLRRRHGVEGDMNTRFSNGAYYVGDGEITFVNMAEVQGVGEREIVEATLEALFSHFPKGHKRPKVNLPNDYLKESHGPLIERGKTPGGENIPIWPTTKGISYSHPRPTQQDMEGARSQRERDELWERYMQAGSSGNAPAEDDPKRHVVYEREGKKLYAYTSFGIHTIGGLHPRTFSVLMPREGGFYEVFNSLDPEFGGDGSNGRFFVADPATLGDGQGMKTTKGDGKGAVKSGLLIVRAVARSEEDVPAAFSRIAQTLKNSRLFGDGITPPELSKGD